MVISLHWLHYHSFNASPWSVERIFLVELFVKATRNEQENASNERNWKKWEIKRNDNKNHNNINSNDKSRSAFAIVATVWVICQPNRRIVYE